MRRKSTINQRLYTLTLCSICLLLPHASDAKSSLLLEQTRTLHCAESQQDAEQALQALRALPVSPLFGLPSDNPATDHQSLSSHAGSIDITLAVLTDTVQKYPELRLLVERTLLSWNYCYIFDNGEFYDLQDNAPRRKAIYPPPLRWSGFRKLGFLDEQATFIPELLTESPLGERAFEYFFHRIYRQQCFPHPSTGEMFHKQHQTKPYLKGNTLKTNTAYPYEWRSECKPPASTPRISQQAITTNEEKQEEKTAPTKTEETTSNQVTQEQTPVQPPLTTHHTLDHLTEELDEETLLDKQTNNPPPIAETPESEAIAPIPDIAESPKATEHTTKRKQAEPPLPIPEVAKPPKATEQTVKLKQKEYSKALILPKKDDIMPTTITIPSIGSGTTNASSTSGAAGNGSGSSSSKVPASAPLVISEKPDETFGFTGNIYIRTPMMGSTPSVGINASWKPIADSFWFIRGNIDYSYRKTDPLSYAWGIGYDDWHPGTWSAQINNWGPIKPGEGLAFDKAIANIGYKFKSDTLKQYNLSANTSLDIPIKGDPALNAGMQWTPKENWYIRANINQPLNGDPATWSYGFGHSDWRVGSFNLEYANYEPNDLFETNFKQNGTVTASYNWEF